MKLMEILLLIVGVGAFVLGYLLPEKKGDEEVQQQIDTEIIKKVIEKELEDAKDKVTEVVDETLEYAVEKTERASERISNEKIMAISEYSETVLADVNKAHQEVMFLYDMLNDKHNNLKETVKHVDKTAKEAEEAANAAAIALAVKAKEDAQLKSMEIQKVVHEKKEDDMLNAMHERASLEKEAKEKEYARRQMARLVLPVQQERVAAQNQTLINKDILENKPMPKQVAPSQTQVNSNVKNSTDDNKELKPLVVRSVEIVTDKPMLNNVAINSQTSSETEVNKANSAMTQAKKTEGVALENKNVEVYSFAAQAPKVERPVKKESQAQVLENTVAVMKQQENAMPVKETPKENNNDRILKLHKEGISHVDIAKELGLGVGEVKLVINLFKGAV